VRRGVGGFGRGGGGGVVLLLAALPLFEFYFVEDLL